jgi:hypothetical protein
LSRKKYPEKKLNQNATEFVQIKRGEYIEKGT